MSYNSRVLDLRKVLAHKSMFLFGPRQTGKSSFIRNQLVNGEFAKENKIVTRALFSIFAHLFNVWLKRQ